MLGVQKQERLLIWLLDLLWFTSDSDTCAWKGCLCDVNIFINFLLTIFILNLASFEVQTQTIR